MLQAVVFESVIFVDIVIGKSRPQLRERSTDSQILLNVTRLDIAEDHLCYRIPCWSYCHTGVYGSSGADLLYYFIQLAVLVFNKPPNYAIGSLNGCAQERK